MKQGAIETALALTWTLGACHRGEASVVPKHDEHGLDVIAEVDGSGQQLPIVLVEQQVASDSTFWTFDPSGHRLASTEFDDCSIWDIETGRLVRSYAEVDAPPCTEWPTSAALLDFCLLDSADGQLTTEIGASGGIDIVELQSGRVRKTLSCKDCESAEFSSWSLQGHQLAFAWGDPARLEIWDADTGTRVAAQTIPITGELAAMDLGWTEAGATLGWTEQGFPIECENYNYSYYCDYDATTGKRTRVPISSHIMVVTPKGTIVHDVGQDGSSIHDLQFGPLGRWVMWTHQWSERRGGTTVEAHFANLANKTDTAGWEFKSEYGYAYGYGGYDVDRSSEWADDGFTHWATKITTNDYEGHTLQLAWQTTVLSPPLGRRTGEIKGLPESSSVEVEIFGLTEQGLAFSGQACGEQCQPLGRQAPPDCTIVDIGSGHGAALIECTTTAMLQNGAAPISLPINAASMNWWWGRRGALALFDGTTFMLIDTVSGKGSTRSDVVAVHMPKLGSELDRLVLESTTATELIDMTTGKALMKLPGEGISEWALSPAGDSLAYIFGDELRVLALPSGELRASWPTTGVELAFRQDGKAIFVGVGYPEQAFDVASGKQLDGSFEWVADMFTEGNDIDPSWRWMFDDERDRVTRLLDGLTLEFVGAGAWLPSTGQYVGTAPDAGVAFRLGSDPNLVPRFDAFQLAKWLLREDLIDAFITGKPLVKPTISVGEAQALEAIARGKATE